MEIIIATKNDLELLMKIRLEMLKVVNDLGEDYVYENSFVENIRKNFLEGDQTNVLCLENGEPVACATLCFISMMPTFSHPTGKRAHLMNVYVRKEYRRMGLARKMLELLIEEGKKRGVTEISLDATQMGKPLYEVIGFKYNSDGMIMDL